MKISHVLRLLYDPVGSRLAESREGCVFKPETFREKNLFTPSQIHAGGTQTAGKQERCLLPVSAENFSGRADRERTRDVK